MIRTVQVVLVVSGLCAGAPAVAETPAWVTESNQAAQKLLAVQGKYAPETVSAFGVEKYDADVLDLKPDTVTRQEADLDAVAQEYTAELKDVRDVRVREDLEILIKSAQNQRTTLALNERLMLPYFDLPQALFTGFETLLDKRTAKARYPAALVRLKRYTGAERGYEPITTLARARIEERFGDKLTAPWSVEVQEELKNQDQYVSGIRDLLQKSGLKGWEHDFATFSAQIAAYGAFMEPEDYQRSGLVVGEAVRYVRQLLALNLAGFHVPDAQRPGPGIDG